MGSLFPATSFTICDDVSVDVNGVAFQLRGARLGAYRDAIVALVLIYDTS